MSTSYGPHDVVTICSSKLYTEAIQRAYRFARSLITYWAPTVDDPDLVSRIVEESMAIALLRPRTRPAVAFHQTVLRIVARKVRRILNRIPNGGVSDYLFQSLAMDERPVEVAAPEHKRRMLSWVADDPEAYKVTRARFRLAVEDPRRVSEFTGLDTTTVYSAFCRARLRFATRLAAQDASQALVAGLC